MQIIENYNLKELNTFRIPALAKFFVEIKNEEELLELFKNPIFKKEKKFFLGGGSNILLTKDFDGLVVKISLLGKKIVQEDEQKIILEVGAGENWHDLVTYTVNKNWGGIENLALIPGTVGAAPVQNIAAYGQNMSDVFHSLRAFNVDTGKMEEFNAKECEFGYRTSVFKNKLRGKYIVTSVSFVLSKNPAIETSYYQIGITHDSIKEELKKIGEGPYGIKDVYNAVINIRTRKLPDPAKIPTVGSFFLNAVVTKEKYEELKKQVPELQCYPTDNLRYKSLSEFSLENEEFVKVATGRLLQEAGWLGKWIGNVGMHDRHALVIVTNGHATGEEIVSFAELIMDSMEKRFGITLVPEVNLI